MQIKKFTDIHTHILPAVDDGAKNLEEALRLAQLAYEDGTRAMILTPHYRGEYRQNTPAWLREQFAAFEAAVKQKLPELELYLGSEIQYQLDVFQMVQSEDILTLCDSRYVLLEFRGSALRSRIVAGVAEARQFGYVPIIAHAELCDALRADRSLLPELLHMGARIQINTDSVLGKNGLGVKWFCHRLLRRRQVHFVASDAHDTQSRLPGLKKAWLLVKRKYGEEYAGRIFDENARAVIENRLF